jgi:hypothetical protein
MWIGFMWQGMVVVICEHNYEPSGSIKDKEFFVLLSD